MPTSTMQFIIQDLGVAGALIVVLYFNIKWMFKYFNQATRNGKTNEVVQIGKLCDKIDSLVTSINKLLISNEKDQKSIINSLNTLMTISIDTQRRVVRIDDRTYHCLGNDEESKQKEGGNN